MPNSHRIAWYGSVLWTVLAGAPLWAQSPDASSDSKSTESALASESPFPDIIVTAQGRAQRLQDVPISATVVGGDMLQRQNIRSIEDLSTRLPNIKITTGSTAAALLNIRGIGSGSSPAFEQSVATFVDGVYRGRSRSVRASLFDIERVEVLRGPQTTYFGNNAIAGALNISTRKPSTEFGVNSTALYSPTDGEFIAEAGVTGPLSESLSGRVAARYSGMNGYIKNDVTGSSGPRLRNIMGRLSLHWTPTQNLTSDLRVEGGRDRDKNSAAYELLDCPPRPEFVMPRGSCARALLAGPVDSKLDYHTQSPVDSSFRFDFVEVGLTNRLQLGEVALTSTTSYYSHKYRQIISTYPINLPGVGAAPALGNSQGTESYHTYSQQLRLESETGGLIEYVLGAYYDHSVNNFFVLTGLYYSPFGALGGAPYTAATPVAVASPGREVTDNRSIFGALTVRPVQSVRVNLGLRYSSVSKTGGRAITFGTTSTPGTIVLKENLVPAPPTVQARLVQAFGGVDGDFPDKTRTDSKLLPAANVQLDLSPDLMAYASYAKGFKAGGFSRGFDNLQFAAENVDAFEIGLKGSTADRKISFGVALFDSKYKNLQESVIVNLPNNFQTVINNAAAARSKGIEAEARIRVSDFLTLNADAAYLRARYVNTLGPCTGVQTITRPAPCVQDLDGKPRAYAPKFSGNVGASFAFPVSDYRVTFDPLLYFTSGYFQQGTIDPIVFQKGYAKVDARFGIGAPDGRWEAAVIVKNVTDKVTAGFRGPIGGSSGSVFALAERPRSVAFQISFKQ